MFKRRTLLSTSLLVPAATIAVRTKSWADKPAAATLPATVKSHTAPYPTIGKIERLDPGFDKYVPADAKIEVLAEGFDWIEGPLWMKNGGYLLFSEIPLNSIYKWDAKHGVSLFLQPSGYFGDRTDLKEPGSNALGLSKKGELILCEHGERRLAKLKSLAKPSAGQTVIADSYEGKRFNSPNDLIVHSSGDIFFTDPPYGLSKKGGAPASEMDDPDKKLTFQGVYKVDGKGTVTLLHEGLERPNGIGLSPDEKILYVANSHRPRPIIMAFDVTADRKLEKPRVFFDGTAMLAKNPDLKGSFDGLTVAADGTLFASGPGGILVITPAGKHLGTFSSGEPMSNCDFGGPKGTTLFVTSDMYLVKIETSTKGRGF
jgi:gluconolactonase